MGETLVAYSVSMPGVEIRADLVRQFEISLSTLRAFNRSQPVVLFSHGEVPNALADLCRTYDVMVCRQPRYEDRLREDCPTGGSALSRYPVLHKFLNFGALEQVGYDQVLCSDFDTVFARDVAQLFDRYGGVATVVAREEIHSGRSPYGYDPTFIDEQRLVNIGAEHGVAPLPPFNLGAVLFNRPDWAHLAALEQTFIDLAWRFATWMAMHPVASESPFAEFQGWHEAVASMTTSDIERSLPFPSTNRWILDEVALWITLGYLPGATFADFCPHDVAQNGEFAHCDPGAPRWTLCHYFSHSLDRVEDWLRLCPAN